MHFNWQAPFYGKKKTISIEKNLSHKAGFELRVLSNVVEKANEKSFFILSHIENSLCNFK